MRKDVMRKGNDIMARLLCNQAGFPIYTVTPPSPRPLRATRPRIPLPRHRTGKAGVTEDTKKVKRK